MSHSPQFEKLCEAIRKNINECDIHTVKTKQSANEPFVLIDVREASEWQQGHLPKAIHLSKGIIERDIEKTIPDFNAEIILYCGGGYRSAIAAESLQKMGYNNVTSMDGGFRAWKTAEFKIQQP